MVGRLRVTECRKPEQPGTAWSRQMIRRCGLMGAFAEPGGRGRETEKNTHTPVFSLCTHGTLL